MSGFDHDPRGTEHEAVEPGHLKMCAACKHRWPVKWISELCPRCGKGSGSLHAERRIGDEDRRKRNDGWMNRKPGAVNIGPRRTGPADRRTPEDEP